MTPVNTNAKLKKEMLLHFLNKNSNCTKFKSSLSIYFGVCGEIPFSVPTIGLVGNLSIKEIEFPSLAQSQKFLLEMGQHVVMISIEKQIS